ncbi:hypothetical protein GQ54DRAFT_43192 [Martensiomyces pterosporus]|nr:hypothetical protein GQ54DRAFT_43192 [Martensiomyces pterosporus]
MYAPALNKQHNCAHTQHTTQQHPQTSLGALGTSNNALLFWFLRALPAARPPHPQGRAAQRKPAQCKARIAWRHGMRDHSLTRPSSGQEQEGRHATKTAHPRGCPCTGLPTSPPYDFCFACCCLRCAHTKAAAQAVLPNKGGGAAWKQKIARHLFALSEGVSCCCLPCHIVVVFVLLPVCAVGGAGAPAFFFCLQVRFLVAIFISADPRPLPNPARTPI